MLICPCFTRVYMDWQLSPCMNFNILQDASDTVELIHLLLCSPTLMPTSFHFSQGQWQIGTLFLPPLEPSSLLIPSRKPSTSSQTLLLTVAEPCHSSSNGWSPIAGYLLKNCLEDGNHPDCVTHSCVAVRVGLWLGFGLVPMLKPKILHGLPCSSLILLLIQMGISVNLLTSWPKILTG